MMLNRPIQRGRGCGCIAARKRVVRVKRFVDGILDGWEEDVQQLRGEEVDGLVDVDVEVDDRSEPWAANVFIVQNFGGPKLAGF